MPLNMTQTAAMMTMMITILDIGNIDVCDDFYSLLMSSQFYNVHHKA